jgi:hypothetical protein
MQYRPRRNIHPSAYPNRYFVNSDGKLDAATSPLEPFITPLPSAPVIAGHNLGQLPPAWSDALHAAIQLGMSRKTATHRAALGAMRTPRAKPDAALRAILQG